MPQVPNIIEMRQQAFAPLERTLQQGQQQGVDTMGKMQVVNEAREKWAIEQVISIYQTADPDLQDDIKRGIVSNPQSQALFQKYAPGMMNTILQRRQPTTKEKIGMEKENAPAQAANDLVKGRLELGNKAVLEMSPEKQAFDFARGKNEAVLPGLLATDPEVIAAKMVQQRQANLELLQKEQDENFQESIIQKAQTEGEAALASAATRGEAERVHRDYSELVETEDGQKMSRADIKYLGLKEAKKPLEEGKDYSVARAKAEDEYAGQKQAYTEWEASYPESAKNTSAYRQARRDQQNLLIDSYLETQRYAGKEAHDRVSRWYEFFQQYVANKDDFRRENAEVFRSGLNEYNNGDLPIFALIANLEPESTNATEDQVSNAWLKALKKSFNAMSRIANE